MHNPGKKTPAGVLGGGRRGRRLGGRMTTISPAAAHINGLVFLSFLLATLAGARGNRASMN